ncbi:MAG TPA: hypothetical protein VE398_01020 [Acidobacteriota bacterium]|nr:hypothetical protein [Acidobacteriota bacterium]
MRTGHWVLTLLGFFLALLNISQDSSSQEIRVDGENISIEFNKAG